MGAAMSVPDSPPLTFLTTKDVLARTGMSRTKLHDCRTNDPVFPKPVRLGSGTGRQVQLRWVESELEAWMRDKMDRR